MLNNKKTQYYSIYLIYYLYLFRDAQFNNSFLDIVSFGLLKTLAFFGGIITFTKGVALYVRFGDAPTGGGHCLTNEKTFDFLQNINGIPV